MSFKILIFSNRSDEFRSFNLINVFLASFLAGVEDFFELVEHVFAHGNYNLLLKDFTCVFLKSWKRFKNGFIFHSFLLLFNEL
jgi:hypothetical protein